MRKLARLATVLLGLSAAPVLALSTGAAPAHALPDGQATVPVMGWNQWNAFGCTINEQLVLATVDGPRPALGRSVQPLRHMA